MSDFNRERGIFDELNKQINYALDSKSKNLAYEALGAVKMARRLGVITKEQFLEAEHKIVTEGLNNPAAELK